MSRKFSVLIKFLIPVLLLGLFWGLESNWQTKAQTNLPIFEYKELRRPPAEKYVSDEIIVKFKPGVPTEKIAEVYQKEQIPQEKYTSPYAGFRVLKIPAGKTVEEMVYRFQKNPLVDYAEPNFIYCALWYPNDPYYQYQWHFDDNHTINPGGATSNPYGGANGGGIRMEEAWPITMGSSAIKVAIIDTGVAYENYGTYKQAPDLTNTTFVAGYDFVNNDAHPNDDEGHGTHVAGTVAQSTNNTLGVAGIAFNTAIMPVKVLDRNGSGTDVWVSNGIHFAVDNGAKVINLSLGGPSPSTTLEEAVSYAYNHGVTVIAAAGNDGTNSIDYPAAYNAYVIAVGATRYDETRTSYSDYGSCLDLVAPGGDVNVDQNQDGYGDGVLQQTLGKACNTPQYDFVYCFMSGTSMSTPHVSGVAALILAQNPSFTPDQVRQRLQTTAEDKGDPGWDQYYGWGIVDAYKALAPIAISLTTDGSVAFGNRALNERIDTTSSGINDVQTIHVDSGPVNLAVKSTKFSDGTNYWNLGMTNGADQVEWDYTADGSTWYVFAAPNTLYEFVNNLATGVNQNIYFRLLLPTSTSSYNQHGATVTIVAIAP